MTVGAKAGAARLLLMTRHCTAHDQAMHTGSRHMRDVGDALYLPHATGRYAHGQAAHG